ncbi:hypothetical protein VZT92_023884 [Zoarces viviparus]|uniref:GIY-YIG homing endonuclease n=1 Tax=Zoarces viviparus TaxID=48416 RepID=A0AAW1E8X0_ZOAVI
MLSTRFAQHKHNITRGKNPDTPLVQHFLLHGFAALSTTVVETQDSWTTAQRKMTERKWIAKLGTKPPTWVERNTEVLEAERGMDSAPRD